MTNQPETIRLLPPSAEPVAMQLAASAALLKGLEEHSALSMRWYRVTPTALLLGSSQRPHEIDLAACNLAGIAAHRRSSGGGVVLASDDLLLLDLAIPREHRLYVGDVTQSYRWLGEIWALTLHRLGLAARLVPVEEARADVRALDPLLKRVCFGGLSPYEIVVEGRKVIGLAQIRRRGGALLQAGVYLRWEPERTAALLAADPQERAALAQQLRHKIAGLDELLQGDAPSHALTGAFERSLVERLNLLPREADWTVLEAAARAEAADLFPAIR